MWTEIFGIVVTPNARNGALIVHISSMMTGNAGSATTTYRLDEKGVRQQTYYAQYALYNNGGTQVIAAVFPELPPGNYNFTDQFGRNERATVYSGRVTELRL